MGIKAVKLRVSVGRQNITALTPTTQTQYIKGIRNQMRQITSNYEKLISELQGQGAEVLLEALQPTFVLSQKYVPKDTGKLAASGFLEIDRRSRTARVVLGYGKGGEPHYAILVHELLHLQHKSPTRAKFLLSALEEENSNIQRRIVSGYRRVAGVTG